MQAAAVAALHLPSILLYSPLLMAVGRRYLTQYVLGYHVALLQHTLGRTTSSRPFTAVGLRYQCKY